MSELEASLGHLRTAIQSGTPQSIQSSLNEAKLHLISLRSMPPSEVYDEKELLLIRKIYEGEAYEMAVFASIKLQDMAALERHVNFLKMIYSDYG